MNTQYISNKFLNWLLNGEVLDQITNLSLGLLTVMPDLSGLNYEEPAASDYQRASVLPTDFSSSTEGLVSNVNVIEFAGTTTGWGAIVGVGLFDSLGQLLWAGRSLSCLQVSANTKPQIEVGKIRFTIGEGSIVVDIAALNARLEALEADSVTKTYVDGEVQRLLPSYHTMKVVLDAGGLAGIDLDHFIIPESINVAVGRATVHIYEDFEITEGGGVSRLTWIGSLQVGGAEAVEEGDSVFITYSYLVV